MTLKELQGMIKEELESYMNEEEVDVDVDTDGGDIDADGAEEGNTDEDVLRQIYDMLKDKFEGGEEAGDDMDDMGDADDADDMDEMDAMEEAKDEDQVEESSTTDVHTQLQERFKKLANIVKG
ncbi:hypothetical protein N9Z72_00050 [Akkermansiaceae bacterium]|nr:hypothetical protein [Akkermansiaceae bacterium]